MFGFFKRKQPTVEAPKKVAPLYPLEHLKMAFSKDISDLHYEDLPELPYMYIASRLFLTGGIAIRFASKQMRCPWSSWGLLSFTTDGKTPDQIGLPFKQATMIFSSDKGKICISYGEDASNGRAVFDSGEFIFAWGI